MSRTTMRRRRENGDFPGAVQDPVTGWSVPVEDSTAAGFRLNVPVLAQAAEAGQRQGVAEASAGAGPVAVRVAELERELVAERHRRELAEVEMRGLRAQLAAKDEHLQDLRRVRQS